MRVYLNEVATGNSLEGIIVQANKDNMPSIKDGWQFPWNTLHKIEGAYFYKLVLIQEPEQIQGILMLTLFNDEMLFMNNIEVAQHNYGLSGKYENVAGCLLAFACKKSFEWGKGNYLGFLSFDSKTELIDLYRKKYGATHAAGHKMFFDPEAGKTLMKKYLNVDI